jgi:hypothetical protein
MHPCANSATATTTTTSINLGRGVVRHGFEQVQVLLPRSPVRKAAWTHNYAPNGRRRECRAGTCNSVIPNDRWISVTLRSTVGRLS